MSETRNWTKSKWQYYFAPLPPNNVKPGQLQSMFSQQLQAAVFQKICPNCSVASCVSLVERMKALLGVARLVCGSCRPCFFHPGGYTRGWRSSSCVSRPCTEQESEPCQLSTNESSLRRWHYDWYSLRKTMCIITAVRSTVCFKIIFVTAIVMMICDCTDSPFHTLLTL